jgi:hypothetical protein
MEILQLFFHLVFQGMAEMLCGPLDKCVLKGTDHCHVEDGILVLHLMLNVHVREVAIIPQGDAPLLDWGQKAGSYSCLTRPIETFIFTLPNRNKNEKRFTLAELNIKSLNEERRRTSVANKVNIHSELMNMIARIFHLEKTF